MELIWSPQSRLQPRSWWRSGSTSTPRRSGRDPGQDGARLRRDVQSRPFDLTTFPNDAGYDELIIARSIPVQSVCEHHLLPFVGVAHVGYLPGADSRPLQIGSGSRAVCPTPSGAGTADATGRRLAPRSRRAARPGCRCGGRASVHDRAWRRRVEDQYGHLRITRPAPQRCRLSSRVLHPDFSPRQACDARVRPVQASHPQLHDKDHS